MTRGRWASFFPSKLMGEIADFMTCFYPQKWYTKQMVESMWLLNLSCFIPGLAGFDQDYGEKSSECLSFLQTLLHQDSLFFRALVGLHSLGSFVFELLSKACAVVLLIKLVSWCINAESAITVLFLFHSGWSRFLLMCKRLKIPKQKD